MKKLLLATALAWTPLAVAAEDKPPKLSDVPMNERIVVYGYVLQRQEDGMLVATEKTSSFGSKKAEGIVWVEGKTFPDDTWVRLTCKADGTYSYETVNGAAKIVDAYIWLDGGKTSNVPRWAR